MKFPQETLNHFQGKIKLPAAGNLRQLLQGIITSIQSRLKSFSATVVSWVKNIARKDSAKQFQQKFIEFVRRTKQRGFKGTIKEIQRKSVEPWYIINSIGATEDMDELEIRKLRIFNQLNFLGIIT